MAATAQTVLAIAPEFSSVSSEIDTHLANAALQLNATAWGTLYDLAQAHLAAHGLALAHPELYQGGQIQSETVGQVSRTYAVSPAPSLDALGSTRFGLEVRRLRRLLGLGATVV